MRLWFKVGLILLLALVIRIWGLNRLPIELFGDELDAGYQAYSVLKTGRDYLGYRLPINFHSFAEERSPMFIYSLVPSVAVFGLNEWGVRMAPALWGTLSILFFFLIMLNLTDKRTALLAALLLTITPWHWHYSRSGFEVTLLLLFVLLAVLFWINQSKRGWLLPISVLWMVLALFTYSSATGFVPFLLVILLWTFRPKSVSAGVKSLTLLIMVAGAILLVASGFGQPGERLGSVSLLSDKSLGDEISFKRSFDSSRTMGEIFHNKFILFSREATANYYKSFSPQFLALDGDPNPAHSEVGGGFGELFHIEYLLAVLGIGVLVARRREKMSRFFLGWLVVAPVSSAVTIGGGEHATRLFLMLPGLVAAAAIGFWALLESFKKGWQKKVVSVAVAGGLLLEVIFFAHHAVVHYRVESWRAWQYGYKEAVGFLPRVNFGTVVISDKGEPALIRYLFWTRTDPKWFQEHFIGDKLEKGILPDFDGFAVGKGLFFGNIEGNVSLADFLRPGMTFMAIQGRDIPGDLVLDRKWSGRVTLLGVARDPELGNPLIQVVRED